MAYGRRAFYCASCGKIIGELYRDSSRVTKLMVYLEPRNREDGLDTRPIPDVQKYSAFIGGGTVVCRCGHLTVFQAKQRAIDKWLKR